MFSKFISKKLSHGIFGVVIALFVLTQTTVVPEQVQDKQEQNDTEKSKAPQITKSEAVQSSLLQINLDYQSYLLAEVFYQDQQKENAPVVKQILSSAQKALKVIFRRTISPNAP